MGGMGDGAVRFRLLGPVEARIGSRLVEVGPARQRSVLAVLLLDANRCVSADQLVERVWGDRRLPSHPRNAAQTYVSLLRRALAAIEDAAIERQSNGYVFSVDERLVDVCEFHTLIEQARATDQDAHAVSLFKRALGLWRGEAFGALETPWLNNARATLDGERRAAERDLSDIQLRRGQHGALLARLSAWAAEHPLDERLAGQLMLALFRTGRQADALRHYQRVREQLADELGADPGHELQQLHHGIMVDDPALAAPLPQQDQGPSAAADPARNAMVVPRQLPAAIAHFTGRADALKTLTALAGRAAAGGGAVVISAIDGTAGIGKTALAVHWSQQAVASFPDGQLYVNLRGFNPTGTPVESTAAIRGFLDALGVAPAQIPADPQAQAGLYRSLLADKRMLVVLDNAREADQVRPLLPGAAGCLVLVTSRNQLSSLVALEGAIPVTLDLLSPGEARDLLARRLGAERAAAEPGAVADLAGLCAGLPLALNIAAARAAARPGVPLSALAEHLRATPGRLAALDAGDVAANMQAVFSWSYRVLSTPAARMFRLLGVHPGPDITVPAAASLTATNREQARDALNELTAAHLLTEHNPGRYTFHDLLRAYAAEQVRTHDTDDERHAALLRVLDHYLHTAHRADRLLVPARASITLFPPQPGTTPEDVADDAQAWAWLDAERPVLLAAVAQAAAHGFDTHAHQLPWAIGTFLTRRGHWQDFAAAQIAALAASQHLGDRTEQARAHHHLGRISSLLGAIPEAHTRLHHALELYRQLDDHTGEAHVHQSYSWMLDRQGRHREALEHAQQALTLYQAVGDRVGQADVLNGIGFLHSRLGDHQQALTHCQQALDLHRDLGVRNGEAEIWDSLGYAHHHLGHHREAVTCYQHALDLFRQTGELYEQATTLTRLGDTHRATEDRDAARDAWHQALTILHVLGHPDTDEVRVKLETAN
jgi:DNA-binding SARP family transcriptional activator/tetratricopeptide (TPR) repeat protein